MLEVTLFSGVTKTVPGGKELGGGGGGGPAPLGSSQSWGWQGLVLPSHTQCLCASPGMLHLQIHTCRQEGGAHTHTRPRMHGCQRVALLTASLPPEFRRGMRCMGKISLLA